MQTIFARMCAILVFAIAVSAVRAQSGLATSPPNTSRPKADKKTFASDIQPKALWDGRKEVEFHAATLPRMVKASEARFLIDNEYVLGITRNGRAVRIRPVLSRGITSSTIGSVRQRRENLRTSR